MLRPSCSTSAGQSVLLCGMVAAAEVAADVIADGTVEEAVEEASGCVFKVALAWDAQAPKEVQERQLRSHISNYVLDLEVCISKARTYGFPSLPRTTPLGNFLGGSAAVPSTGAVAVAPICAGLSSVAFVAIVEYPRVAEGTWCSVLTLVGQGEDKMV